MTLNPMQRTIENIVETNCLGINADNVKGKKLFQLVKYVTGKKYNEKNDYDLDNQGQWYGYDTSTISGERGFIRVTLEHLFVLI